jgi:hypothetical protein
MTATIKLPTPEQASAYVAKMPNIYREILGSFYFADKERVMGDGLPLNAIAKIVNSNPFDERVARTVLAGVEKLAENGIVEYHEPTGFVNPTRLGEEIIAAVTGHRAAEMVVPDLPKPEW